MKFDYDDESDHVPYPIPGSAKIEAGSDRHLLMWDTEDCRLYELFNARKTASGWRAGSGATWDLTSNALRPNGWTSADAAGLPILPGLVRREEVVAGAILHAIRFTALRTRDSTSTRRAITPEPAAVAACHRWDCASASRRDSTSAASARVCRSSCGP